MITAVASFRLPRRLSVVEAKAIFQSTAQGQTRATGEMPAVRFRE